MTFLKTVLIILLVYFGLKFLIRLAAPFLMRYMAKKAGERFEKAFQGNFNDTGNASKEKEGKVSIDKMPRKDNKHRQEVGEYVEYEEIE
ncbi:DUF4834 family protein [Flavobacteriaceae bacterium TK19130]|nr:DUF4834 family protein [Thermobacterium salinum]